MMKTFFINLLKFGITLGLIVWLLKSGKLKLELLVELSNYPFEVGMAILLSITNLWLSTFRWSNILHARTSEKLPMIGLCKIAWIGQFFSAVLPGSVSGDLIKLFYVQKYDHTLSKKFIFASILIDRIMGLSGLILLVGCSSLFFSSHILENAPAMKPLLNINYLLAVTVISALTIFALLHQQLRSIIALSQKFVSEKITQKILGLWDDLVLIRSRMIRSVLLSIIIQFNAVVLFWCLIHPFVKNQMDFSQALASIPIGLMTLALPIAPSGLGVGHFIFENLFGYSGIENGASLFNLYFVVTLMVSLIGSIPYLLTKSKNKTKQK